MKIKFPVPDIPPKKGSGLSMWSSDSEVPRIISLREAALKAMKREGLNECFHSSIKIEVKVFATQLQLYPRRSGYYIGDLDTFVAGVCDGLRAADDNVPLAHELVQKLGGTDIDPKRKLLIDDDDLVTCIIASKTTIDDRQQAYYEIVIEPV